MALAVHVEDDLLVGRILAGLQAPVAGSRPTLGLLHALLAASSTTRNDTSDKRLRERDEGDLFRQLLGRIGGRS